DGIRDGITGVQTWLFRSVISKSSADSRSSIRRGVWSLISRPWRAAILIASVETVDVGCVPAEVTGIVLVRLHSAAASGERAALPVQMNTIRSGAMFSPGVKLCRAAELRWM